MQLNSFTLAKIVIDVATERFSPEWTTDSLKTEELKPFFDPIDELFNESNHGELKVFVDEEDKSINVSFSIEQLYAESSGDLYPKLFEQAQAVNLSTDGRNLVVSCKLPSVWVKQSLRAHR